MTKLADEEKVSPEDARIQLQWINHLLDSDPHSSQLWLKKAVFFHDAMVDTIPRRLRLERVLLWHCQVLREDPSNWISYYNYAGALRELNRHEEALGYIQTAVQMKPDSEYAQELLIQTLVRLGFYQQASQAFREAAEQGVSLDPGVLGKSEIKKASLGRALPEQPSIREIYQNPDGITQKVLDGAVSFVFELADPEMYTFQAEVDELMNLGLYEEAEDACIQFELEHGTNNLSQSYFSQIKIFRGADTVAEKAEISAAFPLLEIASQHLSFEYLGLVNKLFQQGGVGNFITIEDVNDFDEQTRWHLKQLKPFDYNLNDIANAFKPIPANLLRVWNMAVLNFLVARRMNIPILIAYTATTLAEFYERLGETNLPFILYQISATTAATFGQADYFVNAYGKCALILIEKGQYGPAVRRLEASLRYRERIAPFNLYQLYSTLAECYSHLGDYAKAKIYYENAQSVTGVSEKLRDNARWSAEGVNLIAMGGLANFGVPPVLCKGLTMQSIKINMPSGPQYLYYTSQHELYDSLLQAFDSIFSTRQGMLERDRGFAYFQGYANLMSVLVRTALELDLPNNALMHLEAQKTIILNRRLKYLLREKPADLPEPLWEDLQRLVKQYRRIVEQASEGGSEDLSGSTLIDVVQAIEQKLWICGQISDVGTRQIQQKLAIGRLPEKIECQDPEHTLILEFCPGFCFLIRPEDPGCPEVIKLPAATLQESEALANDLSLIVQEWVDHYTRSESLMIQPDQEHFNHFIARFDEVFYRPIAEKLDESKIKFLCIIPHQILHVLPLNILGLSIHSKGCLGQRFVVSFAPNLTCLQCLVNPLTYHPEHALIIADTVPQCPRGICRNPVQDCFALEGARKESQNIQSIFKNNGMKTLCLEGKYATVKTVSEEIGSADVVHIATHGLFDSSDTEGSGILLSFPESKAQEIGSYLQHNLHTAIQPSDTAVGEILTLQFVWQNIDMFRCQLLNLSACSTAMIDWTEQSDEFYGIANGFLYAGVQNIVTNLWPVSDFTSNIFNSHFYEEWLGNQHKSGNALRSAVLALKGFELDGIRPFSHPFFWAGYRVIGLP